ncbi:MAG: diguanylate cyclase (GGDEF domain) [Marinobacter sp. T13-3]|nr:MAG: diguanylate cyclase (GGDEF domain) [Marinobacter sp. T13-3]
MHRHWLLSLLLIIANFAGQALAQTGDEGPSVPVLDVRTVHESAITDQVAFVVEKGTTLSVDELQSLIRENPAVLQYTKTSVLARGIDSGAIWLVATVLNPTNESVSRRVSVRTGWLERVDFFFVPAGRPPQQFVSGDALPLIPKRIASADFSFEPGETQLLVRVETADPMVAPLYMSTMAITQDHEQFETVFYSFVYGVMFALSALTLMLFLVIRKPRYLSYSLYTGSFVAMTASYNGIGMALLWPDATAWQQWAPPLLMLCFTSSGLVFAMNFLNTRHHRPLLHRGIQAIILGYFALLSVFFVLGNQGHALKLAFVVVPIFSGLMLYMGISSWMGGNQSARYFMFGTLLSAIGASITALTVAGLVPYTKLGFYAVDIGMVGDALLLMLALADLVRKNEEARLIAERTARIDLLTGLNNRRGFLPVAESLWNLVSRQHRPICVVMADIDHFKDINDQYGHATGDKVLKAIASELDRSSRESDILARWGGEEFMLLLPETDEAEAFQVVERFRRNVEQLVVKDRGNEIRCTISAGIAGRDATHITLNQVIIRADERLYQAKVQGRNQTCFNTPPDLPDEALAQA